MVRAPSTASLSLTPAYNINAQIMIMIATVCIHIVMVNATQYSVMQ